jgi:hypothetical protein
MSSPHGKKEACSAPHKSRNRPYDSRPGSGPGRTTWRTSTGNSPVRVVLPDEPPRLTPEAARVLLRILLKAHARIADTNNPYGGGAE